MNESHRRRIRGFASADQRVVVSTGAGEYVPPVAAVLLLHDLYRVGKKATDTKATPIDADKLILLNSEAADAAVITTVGGVRTRLNNQVVGSTLGTSGSVALDLAALTGTVQRIAATGNLTFTTSNRAAGRSFELRIAAGGSSRTLTWPAGWVAFGAALPTSLGSGKVLRVAISCGGTADTDIDAAAAESA